MFSACPPTPFKGRAGAHNRGQGLVAFLKSGPILLSQIPTPQPSLGRLEKRSAPFRAPDGVLVRKGMSPFEL